MRFGTPSGLAVLLGVVVLALLALAPPHVQAAGEAAARCVEDTPVMRRNHMDFLKHQRKATVHEGIRTPQHSLAGCVSCHADPATGRVTGSRDAFCERCHSYTAVHLDCWDCHSDRADPARPRAAAGAGGAVQAAAGAGGAGQAAVAAGTTAAAAVPQTPGAKP